MTELASPAAQDPVTKNGRVICHHVAEAAGPTLIAVGGLHGNEPAGILASLAIDRCLRETTPLATGSFVALRGNLAALAFDHEQPINNPRYVQRDLNRLFHHDDQGHRTPDHDERDALRDAIDAVARESRGEIVLLDLHTTSSDSPPFIAVEDSIPARRFAERFALPLILGIEEDLRGLLMDDTTERLRCIALTVEGGCHNSPLAAHTLEAVLLIALEALGLISPDACTCRDERPIETTRRAAGSHAHRVYDIRHREPVRALPYIPDTDAEPFDRVRAHKTRIARQAEADLFAAESGLLFMPNRQRDIRVGDDAYFVVRRVGRTWLRISAGLRASERLHHMLPKILPGVRHRPGHAHDLLVDPQIAAILRRELFHVLGYRLVRFEATPGLPRLVRAARAARFSLHALTRIAANLLRRGSTDDAQHESDEDWIVRRHVLDTEPATADQHT